MRKGLLVFLSINTIIVIFLVRSVFTLLTLLVEDGSADAIHSAEIPAPNSPLIDDRPHLIPKIIHQTYVNESVPEHWREAQKSCVDIHEDYEYKVCLARFSFADDPERARKPLTLSLTTLLKPNHWGMSCLTLGC